MQEVAASTEEENLSTALKLALPNSENKPNVLVVEDSDADREMLCSLLLRYCHVKHSSDGLEALQMFVEINPDIVILDINLPKIDGLKVLQEMRKLSKETFIVMISGDSTRDNIVGSMENGAQGFVKKPYSKQAITAHLDSYNKTIWAECPVLS